MQAGRYSSPEAILAEESLVPVLFKTGLEGCGKALNSASPSGDVAPGEVLELQLWLVSLLARRNIVDVQQPAWFEARMRRRMLAGAGVEDLHGAPHLYHMAATVRGLLPEEGDRQELAQFALDTFRTRYKELVLKALTCDQPVELLRTRGLLCEEELDCFVAGRQAKLAFHPQWRNASELKEH